MARVEVAVAQHKPLSHAVVGVLLIWDLGDLVEASQDQDRQ